MNQSRKSREQDTLIFATSPGIRWNVAQLDKAALQLGQHLSSLLDMRVKIIIGENYEDILIGLENGEIDAAKLGPYAFVQAQARSGVRALVKAIDILSDDSRPYPYRSIIFTRTDSGIMHLMQLKKQAFGFVDRHSTTGYLMATFLLEQAGLNLAQDIEPVFLLSHHAVAEAVIKGKVTAGAIMEEEFTKVIKEEGDAPLRLLSMSPLLSRGPIVVRPDLPRPIERKLQLVLENIHQTPLDALQLLKGSTQRFVAATPHERSLKTVAELAGVSYATVSRAINGNGRIAPATTARILKLVEELGYRPNAAARSLHKAKGEFIGFVLPSLNYPHLDEITDGIQEVLDDAQMKLLLCRINYNTRENALQRQKAYFELFSNSRFEGVLLTQWSSLDPAALEILVRNGRPYILLEQAFLDQGLLTAWQWFTRQRHQHVGLVVGSDSFLAPTLTNQTYNHFSDTNFQFIAAPKDPAAWQHMLEQNPNTPTAFLCTDDQIALTLRHTLDELCLQYPVMTMEYGSLARWANLPGLTFDGAALGRHVAQRLLKMLNIPSRVTENTAVPFWIHDEHYKPEDIV